MTHKPKLEGDAHTALYCDTLVLYLLVESAMGECDLYHDLSDALDAMDPAKMVACRMRFESLPQHVKDHVMDGDPFSIQDEDAAIESLESAAESEQDPTGRKTA